MSLVLFCVCFTFVFVFRRMAVWSYFHLDPSMVTEGPGLTSAFCEIAAVQQKNIKA